ncbi:Sulfate transport system permease protein CysW [Zhongshania aliphaticivorans]|uniref:Sulfate transport system permease protein CysW n=1 Tax=Zhongshania aliphaticivorans TaxID=1470434 RepID=A0A5S9MRW6_9GAMM|nr:iron ABC transporter permease [Zhongshania aliphaticivorans]CAA0079930.1 Sulfate transport system permease protein CysW [Zhongshania aliphaticivorans]CAA0085964.1 Sulfate transport system permease protein CysW [Zhongshania aliphaticivorans]
MTSASTALVAARKSNVGFWALRLLGVAAVLGVLAPILVVVVSWGSAQTDVWQHLIATQLSSLLFNTLVLLIGVGVLVSLLGIGLAWFTVMCDFPGRSWFEWLLMLPMAVPAYVMAFVILGVFDFGGPLQSFLRLQFGQQYGSMDVRNAFTVIVVFSLVLYPYVYMLARSAFLSQSSDTTEAARVLGCSPWQAFYRVALPMARPAIVAGVSLALMETLADFGTVAVFNYDTFTTAIYKAWFGFFNIQAAAQLASILLLFVALTLFAERHSRGARRFVQGGRLQHRYRFQLKPVKAWAMTAMCSLVLLVSFVMPVFQLLFWAVGEGAQQLNMRFFELLQHTVFLAGIAAGITVFLALVLAFNRRQVKRGGFFSLAQLGYALPGSVLAVGIMLSFTFIDNQVLIPIQRFLGMSPVPVLIGSISTLLAAYWIRFLAVAGGPLESSLERIRPSLPEAARTLGASGGELVRRIYLPMLRPGLLTAMVLVFVDVMKEMPATLLLRPYGWDTLAVRIYEMTAEGHWQLAALPALALVAAGLIPVIISIRRSNY